MSATIKGADRLMRKLRHLEKRGARRALRKATTAGTTVLRKAIREATPVDEGLLRKAMDSKVSGRGLTLAGVVGANVSKLQADSAATDGQRPTNIDHLVEFGHENTDGSFTAASGFMRKSSEQAMPAAEARFTAKLAEEIERETMK